MNDHRLAEDSQIFTKGGQIADQDVAHELANNLDEMRLEEGVPDAVKYGYFNANSDKLVPIRIAHRSIQKDHIIDGLEESAKHDELTGLLKLRACKASFAEMRDQVVKGEMSGFGYVRVDLDRFSWVNDIFQAHSLGNIYLQSVAHIMRQYVRPTDFPFRVGGDEFAILYPDIANALILQEVSERVYKAINEQALSMTLAEVMSSDRIITTANKLPEREGVSATVELLAGLISFQQNEDGIQAHFLKTGRGDLQFKKALIRDISTLNFNAYKDLMPPEGTSTIGMTEEEYKSYQKLQHDFIESIRFVFDKLSVSMGGVIIDANTKGEFKDVDKLADAKVYKAKRRGGNRLMLD